MAKLLGRARRLGRRRQRAADPRRQRLRAGISRVARAVRRAHPVIFEGAAEIQAQVIARRLLDGGPSGSRLHARGNQPSLEHGHTDWHDLEEHRFAREVADALQRTMRENATEALVVVAPARTLADLRKAFHGDVKKKIVAELDKDLTKHPVHEIERQLLG
jgi:protein required for attachment to host cells